jgi:hypothetical protein
MEHISVHIRLSPYGGTLDKKPLNPGFVIACQEFVGGASPDAAN